MKKNIFLLFVVVFIISCKPNNDEIVQNNSETLILGHRAAGNIWYGSELIGNSFEAVKFGYSNLDGIEVDLQMSKDSTLWLIHDNEIVNCNNDTIPVCLLTDNEISIINECIEGSLISLEDLFDYLSKQDNKKFVSLDMKAVTNANCFDNNSHEEWIELISEKIVKLYNKYNPNCIVAVESWDIKFLELIKNKRNEIETYLLIWNSIKYSDLIYVKNTGIYGISCNFDSGISKSIIDSAKNLNLKIQLWTPNSETDLKDAINLNPFAIQTDNVNYFITNEK